MKKLLLTLQHFADDPAGGDNPTDNPAENHDQDGAATDKSKGGKPDNPPKQNPKYTDDDLDRIINKKFAEWKQKEQQAVDEAAKLAKMDATQKAEYERDQLKKERDEIAAERDEYKRKDALAEMTKTARKMLNDNGVSVSDELLAVMVTTDAEQTKAAIDGFSKAFKDAVEKAVKDRLRGEPPKAGTGGGSPMSEIDKRLTKYQ